MGISWIKRASERTTYAVGLSPSVASDFQTSDNAFRLMGHAMVTHQWQPNVQFTFGAVYLDRNDLNVLPMAGMIWSPNDDLRIEIAAPRPRVARRIWGSSDLADPEEVWLFLAGEFGGGTWAVERNPGFADELTIRDFRLVLGFESTSASGRSCQIETGYVFGRNLEYESDEAEYEPGDALMLRGRGFLLERDHSLRTPRSKSRQRRRFNPPRGLAE